MKIGEIVSKCNAVFDNERIYLHAEFDETSFSIRRTDVSGFGEVVEVPLASNSLVDCTINIWSMQLSNMVKNMIDGAITTILETPKSTLYPGKKYRLRWIDSNDGRDDEFIGPETYLGRSKDNGVSYWTTFQKFGAETFTEKELQQLKINNPRFAPAIDAMKEPVEDD